MTYRRQERWGYGETRWLPFFFFSAMILAGALLLGIFGYGVAHFVWKYW